MNSKAEDILRQGARLLEPLFSKHGFAFAFLNKGNSSGGPFASAEFVRGNRRCEFHFRYSLGVVTYHLGSEWIPHEEYMCSVLGRPNASRYPGFSESPLDAFCHLRDDLQDYGRDFLEGTDETFSLRIEDGRSRWASRPKLPD
jgi:hypothetical protein